MSNASPAGQIAAARERRDVTAIVRLARQHRRNFALQRQAAEALRDLLAYRQVVEVAERALRLNPYDFRLLELAGLALGRADPGHWQLALDRLTRAMHLAQGRGEGRALAGRLYKQVWRAACGLHAGRPSAAAVAANRCHARRALRHLFTSIEAYLLDFQDSGRQDYYPAVNALTLLTLAELVGPSAGFGRRREWPREVIRRERIVLARDLRVLVDEAAQARAVAAERYWVIATAAELELVAPEEARGPAGGSAIDVLQRALRLRPPPSPFQLDSAIQQLTLLRALGYGGQRVTAGLRLLEHALAASRPAGTGTG